MAAPQAIVVAEMFHPYSGTLCIKDIDNTRRGFPVICGRKEMPARRNHWLLRALLALAMQLGRECSDGEGDLDAGFGQGGNQALLEEVKRFVDTGEASLPAVEAEDQVVAEVGDCHQAAALQPQKQVFACVQVGRSVGPGRASPDCSPAAGGLLG
jgi:hypothetical protein